MSKVYPVGIVGEANYQAAIRSCCAGERVYVCHEEGNPHDDLALRVETGGGRTIGYIARSSWLREAIHEQGRGCVATIMAIEGEGRGALGVVLNVTLTDDDISVRAYQGAGGVSAPRRPEASRQVGQAAGKAVGQLLRGLFK